MFVRHATLPLWLMVELVEREALLDIPNVYSYQTFIDSDKAGYLIRQWVASNLYDRIR
jgi:phosphoinositide-3-kinase regulatory subunit 4